MTDDMMTAEEFLYARRCGSRPRDWPCPAWVDGRMDACACRNVRQREAERWGRSVVYRLLGFTIGVVCFWLFGAL